MYMEKEQKKNEPKEKKPFNLVEELQKPYVVGIKPECNPCWVI